MAPLEAAETHVRVQEVVHLETEVLPAELREDPGQSQRLRPELVLTQPDSLTQIVHYLTAQLVRWKTRPQSQSQSQSQRQISGSYII